MKKMSNILYDILTNFMHDSLKIELEFKFEELSFERKTYVYDRFNTEHKKIFIDLAINTSKFYWQRIPEEVLKYNFKNNQFLNILEYLNNPNANIINISPNVCKKSEVYSNMFWHTIIHCHKPLLLDAESIFKKLNFLYDAYKQAKLTNLNINWKTFTYYYLIEFSKEPLLLKGTDKGNMITRCDTILLHIKKKIVMKEIDLQAYHIIIDLVNKKNISAKDSLSYISCLETARDNEQIAIDRYNEQIARLNEQTAINNEQIATYNSKRAN